VEDLFGTQEDIPMDDRVCRAVAKVRGQIRASATPNLPLLWTEWNVPGKDRARDTPYVGPAVANTIRECDGMVDALSFWTFSDVFEEGGPIPEPFIGQFGLRAKGGINKPSFYDFALLHKLGGERIANSNESVLVTRRKEGTLAIALWNLVDPGQKGATRKIRLSFQNLPSDTPITMSSVDNEHGNVLAAYRAMGSPRYPTEEQIQHMNAATKLPPPRVLRLTGSYLDVELVPNELALLELAPGRTAAQ
jgi:xylan 1,4-beta-xylosidase